MLSSSILEIANKNQHKFAGIISFSKIRRLIDSMFSEYQIKTKIIKCSNVEPGEYFIGGYYQDFNIVLEISVSKKDRSLIITDTTNFVFLVSQVICHELIHYMQDLARDGNGQSLKHTRKYKKQEQRYLSDPDEIQAYAHDIAMELQRHYRSDVFGALRHVGKKRKSFSIKYYNKTFGKGDCEIRRRLLRHVYKWLTETKWTQSQS